MKQSSKIVGIIAGTLISVSTISCLDTPQFYRAAFFQGDTHEALDDWATHVGFRYAEGSTRKSYNYHEDKTHLFNAHGPFDMRMLAMNFQNIDCYPKTKKYLEENGTDPDNITTLFDGKLAFKGRFKTSEYDITLQQNLFSGLYIYAYIPFRKLVLNEIDHTCAVTTCAEHIKLDTFVTKTLDSILAEHCIKPLKTPFDSTNISDPIIAIGWHGQKKFENSSFVDKIRGSIQAGLLLPIGEKRDEDRVFALPFGYNGHWGINVRLHGQANIWKKLGFGVNAGVTTFWDETRDIRMTTTDMHTGWIKLAKGNATIDQGSIWDIGCYLKGEHLFGGFSILASYAFTQKERTWLTVKDDCFLKTALEQKQIPHKEYVVNSDKTLDKWYQHLFHAVAQYDFKAHTDSVCAPFLEVSYSLPITGRYIFDTDMWAGTAEFALRWNF